MKPNEFSDRLWEFAARVGKVVEALPETKLGRHVAGQLVRCGTASAPNYDEARSAESRDDFVHKLGIATIGSKFGPSAIPAGLPGISVPCGFATAPDGAPFEGVALVFFPEKQK